MKTVILSFLLVILSMALPAVELKVIDKVKLTGGREDDCIKVASSFVVTEDGFYFVVDRKEGDIKVFDLKGRFVKRIGSRGYGPSEFVRPLSSDYMARRFVVLDLDRRHYMLMTRAEAPMLKESKLLRSVWMGNDVVMMNGEKVLIAGYHPGKDGKEWSLFTYDFKTKQYDLLVTKEILYGFKSVKDYKRSEDDIDAIGISGFCDWWGDYAYLAWVGDLKVFKIDMKTKQRQTFGKKTDNYRKPVATERLKKTKKEGNLKEYHKIASTHSSIMGIFTNKNYLLLSYTIPICEGERVQSRMLQIYTLDGKFLNEMQITHGNGGGLYLSKDRDDDILYMLQLFYGNGDEAEEYWMMTRFKLVK
jgi:hypothetical protein